MPKKEQKKEMSKDDRNETIQLWQFHDTLLQNYRSLFLSFQAIALPAGGLISYSEITSNNTHFLLNIAVLCYLILAGPVFISIIWLPIVAHRHKMVSYAQWLLKDNEPNEAEETPFELMGKFSNEDGDYHKRVVRQTSYDELLKGPTRSKLDKWLPGMFFVFWILLIGWKLFVICQSVFPFFFSGVLINIFINF